MNINPRSQTFQRQFLWISDQNDFMKLILKVILMPYWGVYPTRWIASCDLVGIILISNFPLKYCQQQFLVDFICQFCTFGHVQPKMWSSSIKVVSPSGLQDILPLHFYCLSCADIVKSKSFDLMRPAFVEVWCEVITPGGPSPPSTSTGRYWPRHAPVPQLLRCSSAHQNSGHHTLPGHNYEGLKQGQKL